MGIYYVYSPINGTVWNQDNYCAGGAHRIVSGLGGSQGKPVDIGGAQGQAVRFTASFNVKSIRIERLDGHVCLTDAGDQDNGIQVYLYRCPNQIQLIGSVIYGHLYSRANSQSINLTSSSWSAHNIVLGLLPGCCGSNIPTRQCGQSGTSPTCGCYNGIHIHLNAGGHSISTVDRQPTTLNCNNLPYFTTSTWLYKFTNTYSDTSPCPI